MARDARLLTGRELSAKAGVTPQVLGKLLRREFDQKGKPKGDSNRPKYRFDLNAPVTQELMSRELARQQNKANSNTMD